MINPTKVIWSVTFQHCDRGQLFDSLRGQPEKFREDAIDSMQLVDDHDRDNIMACIEVENLDELVALLTATASVKCYFGRGVAVRAEYPTMHHYASLFAADGQFAQRSASVSVNAKGEPHAALLEKISQAETALQSIRDDVRAMGAVRD